MGLRVMHCHYIIARPWRKHYKKKIMHTDIFNQPLTATRFAIAHTQKCP